MEAKDKAKRRKVIIYTSIICILAVFMCLSQVFASATQSILYSCNILLDNDSLRVHFINVGQGDAIAISLPDGKTMLIDAGTISHAKELESYLMENVITNHASSQLDYVVMTHSDVDHIGGMARILTKFGAKNIYRPNISCPLDADYDVDSSLASDTYTNTIAVVNQLESQGSNVYFNAQGLKISGQDYEIEFLSPIKDNYATSNEYSPFILLTCYGKTFLFTGDAVFDNEAELLGAYPDLDVDILKVAHHGASTSTSAEFVQAITPEYAVISVGQNGHGHPTSATLANLNTCCEPDNILTTDNLGNITFVIGGGYDFGYIYGDIKTTINLDWYVFFAVFFVGEIVAIWLVIHFLHKSSTKSDKNRL